MIRSVTGALVVGAMTLGMGVPALPAVSSVAAAGTLTATPSAAIAGEQVAFKGRVPAPGGRKVVLQRKQGSSWVRVVAGKANKRGSFSLASAARPTTTKYRVLAPARKGGATAATTKWRRVTTLTQTASLTLAASAARGAATAATGTFTPARPGRAVLLQRQSGTTWVTETTGVQGPGGGATLPVDTSSTGSSTYRVVAAAANGAAAAVSSSRSLTVTAVPVLPDTTPPGPVTSLQATGTTTSVSLSWANPSDDDLTGVMIRRAVGATPPGSPSAGTLVVDKAAPGTSHTDSGLNAGTQYSYALFAHDEVPNHAAAATLTTATAVPDTTAPGPVTSLVVTGTTTSSVSLSWVNPSDGDLTGVMIRRAVGATPPGSPSAGTLVVDKAPPGTSHTDSGLTAGTQYSYALFAHDGLPNHATAATVTTTTATPDTTPPGPVTAVVATKTQSTVSLSWTNPGVADYAGVMIRRSLGATAPVSAGSGTLVADVAAPGTTHLDTGLAPGTQYSYALFAHDAVPNHAAAATVTVTTDAATASDWAQPQRDPGHTSWSPDEQILTPANIGSLAEEWSVLREGSPAISGGLVYTVGSTDIGTTTLGAYDLATGEPSWRVLTDGSCTGPLVVTASLVIANCGGTPRAYDRGGSHAVVWDVATTDPGQSVQLHLVIGTTLVAWTSGRVAAYRLSDGQRVWQQLLPSGASFVVDVAASGGSVVVAYDDRLRALNLATGAQQWVRTDLQTSSLVIAGSWIYAHDAGMAKQVALASGTDGWSVAVDNLYRVAAADGDSVYVWEAAFDFGPPSPSVLHALRISDGSERWQSGVPSRLGTVAIVGDLVWFTSTEIFTQGKSSNLIAVKRADGAEVKRFDWPDNIYGHHGVAFGGGKVVLEQGGSFGYPPGRLRILGLSGPVPVVDDRVLPLSYVGTAYSRQLSATGPGPFTWSLVTGTPPTGMSLSAGGVLSGTPSTAATRRFTVEVTAANGRTAQRTLSLQAVQSGTPGWGTVGRDFTRNPFEPSVPSLDAAAAPGLAFRWKTAPPVAVLTQYGTPVTVGARLYEVDVDGQLKAWDTTGSATNRAPLWAVDADATAGPNSYAGTPVVDGSRLLVFDNYGYLTALSTTNGSLVWRTTQPATGMIDRSPLAVGGSVLVMTSTGGVKAFAAATGAPLWGGAETSAPTDFYTTSLSSDGTLAFALTGCELYAIKVSDGAIAWHTPVQAGSGSGCGFVAMMAPPLVVGGTVYANTPFGLLSATAATGAPLLRVASGSYGPHAVVGGAWIHANFNIAAVVAIDAVNGEVLWTNDTVSGLSDIGVSRDLVVTRAPHSQITGLDRTTGEVIWDGGSGNQSTSQGIAIGSGMIFAGRPDAIHAFGPP